MSKQAGKDSLQTKNKIYIIQSAHYVSQKIENGTKRVN
jgi:hypothetical protein